MVNFLGASPEKWRLEAGLCLGKLKNGAGTLNLYLVTAHFFKDVPIAPL